MIEFILTVLNNTGSLMCEVGRIIINQLNIR